MRNPPSRTQHRIPALLGIILCLSLAVWLVPALALRGSAHPAETTIAEIIDQVDEQSLLDHVADLSGELPVIIEGQEVIIETRYSYAPGIDQALTYVREHHEDLGLTTEVQEYLNEGRTWHNLVATLTGATHPERIVIICAHADSTNATLPSVDAPGADDNATGTAAVMMAAKILSKYEFENTIRFISFSGEEQGLKGSAAYAERSAARGEEIIAVINLDMLGWDDAGGPAMDIHAGTDPASLALAKVFSETVSSYDIDLLPQIIGGGATRASDHSSFWNHDYPAVLVIEDYVPSQPDFNPYYHSSNDLLEYINPTYFTEMTEATIGTVATLAVPWSPETPTATPSPTLIFSATATSTLSPTPSATAEPTLTATGEPTATAPATATATRTSEPVHRVWLPLAFSDRGSSR